jgi:hypothetical protein
MNTSWYTAQVCNHLSVSSEIDRVQFNLSFTRKAIWSKLAGKALGCKGLRKVRILVVFRTISDVTGLQKLCRIFYAI